MSRPLDHTGATDRFGLPLELLWATLSPIVEVGEMRRLAEGGRMVIEVERKAIGRKVSVVEDSVFVPVEIHSRLSLASVAARFESRAHFAEAQLLECREKSGTREAVEAMTVSGADAGFQSG